MTRMRSILLGAGTSLVLVLNACGSGPATGAVNTGAGGGGSGSGPAAGAVNPPGGGGGDSGSAAGITPPASGSSGSGAAAGAGTSAGGRRSVRGPVGPGVFAVKAGTAVTTVKQTDGLRFVPTSLTVNVGDIVRFTNSGTIGHNVTFQYAGVGSPLMKGGSSFLVEFTSPGNYPFICTLHIQGMFGTITVR